MRAFLVAKTVDLKLRMKTKFAEVMAALGAVQFSNEVGFFMLFSKVIV
jgi:hypothetical protein